MKASDMLRNNNGLKTTQSVLNKQQSGVDAAQKVAQTQAPVFTQQQLDAAGKKVDQMNAATPQNETPTMKAAREKTIATQQAIANGVDVNQGATSDEEDKPSVCRFCGATMDARARITVRSRLPAMPFIRCTCWYWGFCQS